MQPPSRLLVHRLAVGCFASGMVSGDVNLPLPAGAGAVPVVFIVDPVALKARADSRACVVTEDRWIDVSFSPPKSMFERREMATRFRASRPRLF